MKFPDRKFLPWLVVLALVGAVAEARAASWVVRAQPAKLMNGAPVLFRVRPPVKLDSLKATWLNHEVNFSYDSSTKTWFALAGVSIETAPGSYPLQLTGEPSRRATRPGSVVYLKKFSILRAKYPRIELTVEGKYTEPSPEQLKKINEDKATKQDYLNRVTPDREWAGNFAAPADASVSDIFGTQRVFNGKTQSSHLGLDFRVPSGTPVKAMNAGKVLLARPLYFEGNCVVLDHGQGLLTIYMHLSEIKVSEGDRVERGQVVALSGGTGRATGPHLHVAVRWQGAYLDPARLLQLQMPQ